MDEAAVTFFLNHREAPASPPLQTHRDDTGIEKPLNNTELQAEIEDIESKAKPGLDESPHEVLSSSERIDARQQVINDVWETGGIPQE